MNNYGGNNVRRSNSNSGCQSAGGYMFGGSYGPATAGRGQSYSSTNFGGNQGRRTDGVRDCMFWPGSLAPGQAYGSQNQYEGSQYGGAGNAYTMVSQSQQSQFSYPQPKAFVQVQGQGQGGEVKPMQIPCQMGPSGSQMAPMAPMEPLTIKVTAPPGAGANGQPIQFQINPNALWGQRR